jgi:ribonucleoside-triphosphate reductase (formate)
MPNIIQSGTEDAPYYTNSSQLPVGFTDDPFEALEEENELQCKYTWGTVLHMYMWVKLTDTTSCKNFVRTVTGNYQLSYITISPTFLICPKRRYVTWEHDYCQKCDTEVRYNGTKFDLETRKIYTDDADKIKKNRTSWSKIIISYLNIKIWQYF